MRLAFNKIAVIIKDDITDYSFDTSPLEHLPYQADLHYPSIIKFKELLKRKVLATLEAYQKNEYKSFLDNFTNFKLSTVAQEELGATEFILKSLEELKMSINNIQIRDSTNPVTIDELRNYKHIPRVNIISQKNVKQLINPFEMARIISNYCNRKNIEKNDLINKHNFEEALQLLSLELIANYGFNELEALEYVNSYLEKYLALK